MCDFRPGYPRSMMSTNQSFQWIWKKNKNCPKLWKKSFCQKPIDRPYVHSNMYTYFKVLLVWWLICATMPFRHDKPANSSMFRPVDFSSSGTQVQINYTYTMYGEILLIVFDQYSSTGMNNSTLDKSTLSTYN